MGKFKRTKFPNGNFYSRLTLGQKAFIQNKVQELGGLEEVKSHYNKKALVDRYALTVAKAKPTKVWSPPEGQNEYKVGCPKCQGEDPKCPACGGKGYNVVVFKDGKREI